MTKNPHNVLIVGATSSLAEALCRELAGRGHKLMLAGRDAQALKILSDDLAVRYGTLCETLAWDMLSPEFSAQKFIDQSGDFSRMVIATGDMGSGNNVDIANIAYVLRINYTIPAQIAALAAEKLAARKSGHITIISSVAGDRGRQSNYAYGSAKAALSAFASGLRNRYFKQGVQVLLVKPGFVDTPMTWPMKSPLVARRERVARDIARAMEKGTDVLYTPWFWRFIMLIICHIPEKIFKRLSL